VLHVRGWEKLPVEGALPLLFLAAVAHPDEHWRTQVAHRLDDYIAAGEPLHSTEQVREILLRHATTVALPPAELELAVRLVRLAFARRTKAYAYRADQPTIQWVRITAPPPNARAELTLTSDLEGLLLARFALRDRGNSSGTCSLLAGAVASHLNEVRNPSPRVWTTCCGPSNAQGGFRLLIEGELPWKPTQDVELLARALEASSRLGDEKTLGGMGLALRCLSDHVLIEAGTPEAILQFSACLARGETLTLQRFPYRGPEGRVVVLLRDFDGDRAELPCLASYGQRETWLQPPALPPLDLSREEKTAIARWLYPPDCWLDGELVEDLCGSESAPA
jgi:hypothetical protein